MDDKEEIKRLRKALSDAEKAVEATMKGEPGFDLPSLRAGLQRAITKEG